MSAQVRTRGRILLIAATLAALGCWAVPVARAEFGPIELVSKSAKEQAERAVEPAISAGGRYLAFAGALGNREGIFRKDLQTGAVDLVVELTKDEVAAALPSISADGRYISFTTAQQLDAAHDPEAKSGDVYVADMSTTPPSYELASSGDGSSEALPGDSSAAGRVALSEDGRRLAFVNQGEVYIRELGTTKTILISARRDPTTGMTTEPVPGGAVGSRSEGAAISGDGSTVAWVGRHLPDQVPMLGDEEARVRSIESGKVESVAFEYHEPLWRRVPTPLEARPPTRRIVGGGDPLASGCPPDGTLADPACQGPFPDLLEGRSRSFLTEDEGLGWGVGVPRLSRDGETVALVGDPEEDNDLFLIDMAVGLSRREAVRRLTQWVNPLPGAVNPETVFQDPEFEPMAAEIIDCGIAPDGDRIAFATARDLFPLAPPTLISPAPPQPNKPELYQIDLKGETIERVTPGTPAGASLTSGPLTNPSPSYDEDGRLLSFASVAYNLVAGDTNEASDAFVVESPFPAPGGDSAISPRPASIALKPLWRITVNARSLPDGAVKVVVGVPGAGIVRTKASARLGSQPRLRRVAAAHGSIGAAGVQRLELRLPGGLRRLARRKGGLYAQFDVAFKGPGGKPLHAALDARFLVHRGKVKR